MTRINLGVQPSELCDQMLIAAYRELPRMTALAIQRLEKYHGPGPGPDRPTLGIGHMAYFLPYGLWLVDHYSMLVSEMLFRGFSPQHRYWSYPDELKQDPMPVDHIADFKSIIRHRINQQLKAMKRVPKWTNRSKPSWVM
jgi:Pyrimidine dimer DNA glycosylase